MNRNMFVALIGSAALIGGATLLSLAFGWKVGVGVACFVHFHKSTD